MADSGQQRRNCDRVWCGRDRWCFLRFICVIVGVVLGCSTSANADLVSHIQVLEPRQLYTYTGYKDVQIFHYVVPQQALQATWSFSATESGGCKPKQVILYLQQGSYPVVSPDNSSYPGDFYLGRTSLTEVLLRSDATPLVLNVSTPEPGDWFAAAFLPDRNERIEQKGLHPECKTMLSSSIKCFMEHNVVHLLPGVSLPQRTEISQHYKFYVPENTWTARIVLKSCSTFPATSEGLCPVVVFARPAVLYSATGNTPSSSLNCSQAYNRTTGHCVLEVIPRENAWHYVWLEFLDGKAEFQITVETSACENGYTPAQYLILSEFKLSNSSGLPGSKDSLPNVSNSAKRVFMPLPVDSRVRTAAQSCWPRVPLLRKTLPGNFVFNYEPVLSDKNDTGSGSTGAVSTGVPAAAGIIPISNLVPTLLIVPIQPILDIGGTLAFELSLDASTLNVSNHNVTVVACIEKDQRSLVFGPGNCSSPLSISVNSSATLSPRHLMIPFPEPGNWYVTLAAFCYRGDALRTKLYDLHQPRNRQGRQTWPEVDEDSADAHVLRLETVDCDTNSTNVVLGVASSSCVNSGCGFYGRCYQYISGGFIFSTCVCTAGRRGWGCTDDTAATPNFELLLATLLLTLSNLLFIPAVILAVYRRYYTEALVYFLTMFFSTFYHACDGDAYTFCLMRLSVLQFCDFYLAIMSVWVTLVAMAHLHPTAYSMLHMAGAVGIALGVEYDRTGLWVFVVPSAVGVGILTASWAWHCQRQKACFPDRKIWFMCLLPGVLLAAVGLACFAFLETEQNYKFVHSGWHSTMALCILFLLPPARKHKGRHPNDHRHHRSALEQQGGISYVRADEMVDVTTPNFESGISDRLIPVTP